MSKSYEEMTREELIRELRLISLRRQVTPHFLFNSLSVAMSLIMQSPKSAVKFLRHLALMYRYLLIYGNEYHVPVEQELEMVQQFFDLMKVRHVDSISLSISEEVSRMKRYPLPPLALQGLLENAIKHNTHTKEQPLEVVLDVVDSAGVISADTNIDKYLCMSNNIAPLVSKVESSKMGLKYMNETMELLFHQRMIVQNDGKVFRVFIPLIEMQE